MWMTLCTRSERWGFGGFWKKSVSWVLPSEVEVWLSLAHRCLVADATRVVCVWGGRWKSHHRKIVPLYLCRKTFKLKGNKRFRTWTKQSYVFFVFRDSYVIYMCVTNILCTFHISIYRYVTKVYIYMCVCVCCFLVVFFLFPINVFFKICSSN